MNNLKKEVINILTLLRDRNIWDKADFLLNKVENNELSEKQLKTLIEWINKLLQNAQEEKFKKNNLNNKEKISKKNKEENMERREELDNLDNLDNLLDNI